MNKKLFVTALVGMSILTGCAGTQGPKISVDKTRAPISLSQVESIAACVGNKDIVYKRLGSPLEIKKEGRDSYWTYLVKDSQLKKETFVTVRIGYSDGVSIKPKLQDFPYKTQDVARDKYYYLYINMKNAECEIPHLQFAEVSEKDFNEKEKINDEIVRQKNKADKYKDQLFDLKMKLLDERGSLPDWFKAEI